MNKLLTISKFGLLQYFDYSDTINIKKCSKYLNQYIIPVSNVTFKISYYRPLDIIKKMLLKIGNYVRKIIIDRSMSNINCIYEIVCMCTNLCELEISRVIIVDDDNTKLSIKVDPDKIITKNYLNSLCTGKLKKIIICDSFINNDFALMNDCILQHVGIGILDSFKEGGYGHSGGIFSLVAYGKSDEILMQNSKKKARLEKFELNKQTRRISHNKIPKKCFRKN
jgi:hypothetical protein